MPKFAANLSFLFTEQPFQARFELAAAAGFKGVEYLFPYDYPAEELLSCLRENGLEQVLFNLPPGNWSTGERGLACLPDRQDEFFRSVDLALEYAGRLSCRRLHCMAGLRPDGVSEGDLEGVYVENLRHAADRMATMGVMVTIEPINSRFDMPGYWLDDVDKAFRLQRLIGRDNVKVQYDVYHAQVIAGDLARRLTSCLAHIGHIQIADNPGRHEPGSGEINFPFLFALLDRLGYDGWIGCEYKPLSATEQSFGWLPKCQH